MRAATESGLVERLARPEKESAVEVLAAAFHEYPVMRFVLSDAGVRYGESLRELIGFFCESRLSRDWPLFGIRENDTLVAVAAVNGPERRPRPPALRAVYEALRLNLGESAIRRLESFEAISSEAVPEEPHYYLGMIGVRPEWQKRGFAGRLLEHLHRLADADPASRGVCLSTENPANVSLYRQHGYEILGEAGVGDFRTWCMFRRSKR